MAAEAAAAARGMKRLGAVEALLTFARLSLASGSSRFTEIEDALEAASAVARHCSGQVFEAAIGEQRARLAALRGHHEEATRGLAEALAAYAEIGATGHERRLTAEIDSARPRQTA
jgi:hypothetical protein